MARWEPDAQGRLLRAALDLFVDNGYDATTTAQIAERAGLTKTTLFRLFRDKREILFQGQEAFVALAASGVADAPADAAPRDLLVAALEAMSREHTDDSRHVGRTMTELLAGSEELRERAAYKRAAITSALEEALTRRIGDARHAGVLADLGMRAYYAGFDTWISTEDDAIMDHILRELDALEEAALRALGSPVAVRRRG